MILVDATSECVIDECNERVCDLFTLGIPCSFRV